MKAVKAVCMLLVAASVASAQAMDMKMLVPMAGVVLFAEGGMCNPCATTRGGKTESMVRDACVATAAGMVSNMVCGGDWSLMSVAKEACCQACALALTKSQSVKDMLSGMPVFRKLFVSQDDDKMCVQDLARYGMALAAVKAVAGKMDMTAKAA